MRLGKAIVTAALIATTIAATSVVAGSAAAAPAPARWSGTGAGIGAPLGREGPVAHVAAHCGTGGQCGGGPLENAPNELDGVSCVSPTDCVAVGSFLLDDAHPRQTLIESWDGSNWTVVASPNPGTASILSDVACVSATDCVAVGSYGNAWPPDRTLVESWDGSTWTVVPSPTPTGTYSNLDGVSCTGPATCMAVGSYRVGSGLTDRTLVEAWNGTSWTITSSPSPGSTFNSLRSVSCTGTTDCMAVGGADSGSPGSNRTLAESWNGSTWTVVPGPSPPLSDDSLSAVSCTTSANCVAVGDQSDGMSVWRTLAEAWDGSSWRVVPSPNPGTSGILFGVSCSSATSCVAVGRSSGNSLRTAPSSRRGTAWRGPSWRVPARRVR